MKLYLFLFLLFHALLAVHKFDILYISMCVYMYVSNILMDIEMQKTKVFFHIIRHLMFCFQFLSLSSELFR